MAKRVQVSTDDTTYRTLPGASGEFSLEMANVDDTIFGQSFKSESPSIGMWDVKGAAYFKGVAGYSASVKIGGSPVSATAAASTLVSGKTYRVDNIARRIMSYANPIVVYDNAVDHTADVLSIDYLNGEVTFLGGYTVTGPVTIDYYYVPTTAIAKARSFNLQQQAAEIDTTDYVTAQANGGMRTYIPGLRSVSLELGDVWATANDYKTALLARNYVYIEISPNNTQGNATTEVVFKGFFKYMQQNQSGNVGALEEEKLNFSLYVPDGDLVVAPFKWYFGSAPALNRAIRDTINAWQNETLIYVKYLADGTNGHKGSSVVTDCSLQNSFDGQNEFSFAYKGSGAITAVP